MIKNKKSKEWKIVDKLISGLNNKILLGNVYAERFLHPTGWRSSYNDLKNWLDKYNDHPDATRITRIALKRKPNNFKSPKKPTPGFLNGYGTYKANVLKPRFPIDNKKYKNFQVLISYNCVEKKYQQKEIINVKDNPPQAPVSTHSKPSIIPSSMYSSKKKTYFSRMYNVIGTIKK